MQSKASIDLASIMNNVRIANILFCGVIFIFGLFAYLLTRSLPALFVSFAFFLFGCSYFDESLDVNRRYVGRNFAFRTLGYFLVLTALIACFKL